MTTRSLARLVGDDFVVTCADGQDRRLVNLDNAASTSAFTAVADRVAAFLPTYSSVHRGAGHTSRVSTAAYEEARHAALRFAGRSERDDIAIICRNTTEAINHLAYRLRLAPTDVVVTTVVEHHANLLPWGRIARRRYVECSTQGTFTTDDVTAALDAGPPPALLAITGASNVTGWMPPLDEVIEQAHARGVRVFVDGAQLAPHHPLPAAADFVAWSGHKMYAPFGAGILIGPRDAFADGDPFLAGGGAVDAVALDEVMWTAPPEREEAGSPNVVGAVALHEAIDEFERIGWPAIHAHEEALSAQLRQGLASIPGVDVLGPPAGAPTFAVAAFRVSGVHHALVAARLAAEYGIATRHGCFCAHPYLFRLLGLDDDAVQRHLADVRRGDRSTLPGAVRASAGFATSGDDVDTFLGAVRDIASGDHPPIEYVQDAHTGDYTPASDATSASSGSSSGCANG